MGQHRVSTLLQYQIFHECSSPLCPRASTTPTLWGHHSPDVYECNPLGSQQWEWSLQSFKAQQPCLPLLEKALETHLRLVWPRPAFNVLRFPAKPSMLGNWHDQALLDQDSPGRPQLAAGITGNKARGSNLAHLPLPPNYQKSSILIIQPGFI